MVHGMVNKCATSAGVDSRPARGGCQEHGLLELDCINFEPGNMANNYPSGQIFFYCLMVVLCMFAHFAGISLQIVRLFDEYNEVVNFWTRRMGSMLAGLDRLQILIPKVVEGAFEYLDCAIKQVAAPGSRQYLAEVVEGFQVGLAALPGVDLAQQQ